MRKINSINKMDWMDAVILWIERKWEIVIKQWESNFEKMVPPGVDYKGEIICFCAGLAVSTIGSMIVYFSRFFRFRDSLYESSIFGRRVLMEGAVMPDFKDVFGGCFLGFACVMLYMLAFAGYHYFYHFQGSRSIYLMKRLPKRRELLKRCLMLPIAAICICLAVVFLLLLVYYWHYMHSTPTECLTPGQWQKLMGFGPGG